MSADGNLLKRAGTLFSDPELYEAQYADLTRDIRFYVGLSRKTGGPVLELGVGAGRLAETMVREGFDFSGVDSSREMLSRARHRLDAIANAAVTLECQNFCRFQLGRKFNLIFSGFNSLQHLGDLDEFRDLLGRIREHLNPGGWFAFDLVNPRVLDLSERVGPVLREKFYDERCSGVCEVWEVSRYEEASRVRYQEWEYRWADGRRELRTVNHRLFFHEEIVGLLESEKFATLQSLGDFVGSGYSVNSTKQIFVCR